MAKNRRTLYPPVGILDMKIEDLSDSVADHLLNGICPDCHGDLMYFDESGIWFCPVCFKGHAIAFAH